MCIEIMMQRVLASTHSCPAPLCHYLPSVPRGLTHSCWSELDSFSSSTYNCVTCDTLTCSSLLLRPDTLLLYELREIEAKSIHCDVSCMTRVQHRTSCCTIGPWNFLMRQNVLLCLKLHTEFETLSQFSKICK